MTGPTTVDDLVAAVPTVDREAARRARDRWATLAMPPGALGRLGDLGVQLAGIAGVCPPPVAAAPAVVVCAGDHGVHGQGVTAWPQQVTAAMVEAVQQQDAAVTALAGVCGARVHVLDVGVIPGGAERRQHGQRPPVADTLPDAPGLHRARVRSGTRDLRVEDAMTPGECRAAVLAGADLARRLLADGVDLLVTGDLGIANTTASAALIAACTGRPAVDVTGRGAGLAPSGQAHKMAVVADAVDRVGERDALGVLAGLGGLEHAALVGVMLAGGAARVPVLLDGVVADAAALVACALAPPLRERLVAGHRSAEAGADVAMAHLDLEPLLDLRLRLGEGTGALLAVPVLQSAAAACSRMATLGDLGLGPE